MGRVDVASIDVFGGRRVVPTRNLVGYFLPHDRHSDEHRHMIGLFQRGHGLGLGGLTE